jgi:hypothetical protein
VVRARNGEEMSPRPLDETSGTDRGLEARQGGFDRQLSAVEHKAQAAVDLLLILTLKAKVFAARNPNQLGFSTCKF